LGGDKVTIQDALESLKFLALLESRVKTDENARIASRIVKPEDGGDPTITDVLEILKKLAGLINRIDIPYLDDLRIEQREIQLRTSQTHTIRVNTARGQTATFRSVNESIATVDSRGVVTAVSNGGTTFVITYINNQPNSLYIIRVLASTTAISISNAPQYISIDEQFPLIVALEPRDSVDRVAYAIDDESKARMTRDGRLLGLSVGTFRLTVTSGRFSQTYTVTVENPTFSTTDLKIAEGKLITELTLTNTRRTVQWRSSNPSVAIVDQNGVISTLQPGYTCIIAKVGSMEYFCDLRVVTELEIRINELQARYPHEYYYNSHTPDSEFPLVSQIPCDHSNDRPNRCRGQCAGYARQISNEVFGANAPRIRVNNTADVKQGDYIRYGTHSIFIIRVEHEGEINGYDRRRGEHTYATRTRWYITDCNWGRTCRIHWNRFTEVRDIIPAQSYSRF